MTIHGTTEDKLAGPPHPPGPLHRWVLPIRLPTPVNPALLKHAAQRERFVQNRISDAITAFAGSITFIYIHIL